LSKIQNGAQILNNIYIFGCVLDHEQSKYSTGCKYQLHVV